ncbi:uncharacterized protein F5Z01DRAFT_749744 [Emericellopsis atlantica]|uniref:Uncharacterized protein n=1 Tax=Emericellopsis atlantica TaxID=2614577 RepID=A0A9P8CRQ0_9HYPO|nr:uncharacterized protein F5Z01DRAFT_749744 [Emericellopsis atlantica]KAG9254971.1 hypothetical protein F5Z01DRAFT_749744 [Emericellopsis atlantica]
MSIYCVDPLLFNKHLRRVFDAQRSHTLRDRYRLNMDSCEDTTKSHSGQVRILLQTRTHLPLGAEYGDKIEFMKNLACQHLWKRDFDPSQERWYPYSTVFGLADRLCFLLIDHFGYDHAQTRHTCHCYGLNGLERLLFSYTKNSLLGFAKNSNHGHSHGREPDGTWSPVNHRLIIKSFLQNGIPICDTHIAFVKKYPEHAKWLRDHLEEHLWAKLEPHCELPAEAESLCTLKRDGD